MAKRELVGNLALMEILQKELVYFLILAETENISKAAERLGVQQSGLSRALQRLEFEVGQKLFQRKSTGLVLTHAGQQLAKAVKVTQKSWIEAFKMVNEGEVPTGLVKLGFHPSFGQAYFPAIVKRLDSLYPQIKIEAYMSSSAQITRRVNEQELDFGLVISDIRNPEIVKKKVGSDFIAAFQRNLNVTPQKVLFNPEMRLSASILRKHGHNQKIIINDYDIIAVTCLQMDVVGLLPYSVAKKYPVLQQVGGVYLKADVSCISHKGKITTPDMRKIFETIVHACILRDG